MKCNQSRPRFELVSPCPFPTPITIIPRAIIILLTVTQTVISSISVLLHHTNLSLISNVTMKYNALIYSLWMRGECMEIIVSKAGKDLSVMNAVAF